MLEALKQNMFAQIKLLSYFVTDNWFLVFYWSYIRFFIFWSK